MTVEKPENRPVETVEDAMNQVLQAERSAEQSIEACKHEARKIRESAQQQAIRIDKRTNERLSMCHMHCTARLTREIKERERAAAASDPGESACRLDEAAMSAVVEALAVALTGITPAARHPKDR